MWWTPQPDADGEQVWLAFATGDYARDLIARGEAGALAQGLDALCREIGAVVQPDAARWVNWAADPYALGGYSSVPVGAVGMREVLAQPVEDRLFFAGEACAPQPYAATVHGAYHTGRRAAQEICSVK
jgi:monoamine oxidase